MALFRKFIQGLANRQPLVFNFRVGSTSTVFNIMSKVSSKLPNIQKSFLLDDKFFTIRHMSSHDNDNYDLNKFWPKQLPKNELTGESCFVCKRVLAKYQSQSELMFYSFTLLTKIDKF